MSDIINILPDSVANQIAAGEVVDRPASAVKELLENSMDAGASEIQLIIKDAGRTLIQVIDNGCGMSDSDARLCFERHATSKIHKADDLFAIRTMGFRGEALASIAAIAQVEMKSKLHDAELGTCIEIEGSVVKKQAPCTCNNGTSLSVKNLFFNVPARRNFLKKDSIELSHIEEVFKRIVLAHCDISFSFYNNGKLQYDLQKGTLAQRIVQIYGESYKSRFYPIEEQTDVVRIKGYVSKAEYAKKIRGEQYLFVNGRFIKHPGLSAAIEKAFNELIPDRHYPSYFVMLDVDPSRIDINIHPTKTEIKFIDEHAIFAILRAATKKALGQFSLATELEFNPSTEIDFTPASKDYIPQQPQIQYNSDYNPFEVQVDDQRGVRAFSSPHYNNPSTGARSKTVERQGFSSKEYLEIRDTEKWEHFFDDKAEPQADTTQEQHSQPPQLQLSGCTQVLNRWIVGAMPSGLLLIDQHEAHERIIYERLMSRNKNRDAQQLLFPVNCSFTAADAEIFSELLPDISKYGFVINELGKSTFVVSAIPTDMSDNELQQLFDQMISEYKGSLMQKFNDREQCLCRSLAHQTAIKPGKVLLQEEMQQIVADLFSCQVPEMSPSGKRILKVLTETDLIGLF
ncbi:MAG: DNA mismatch repair endonuclease MutL [Bacteroidales bacterium]|nr:DNA mismatch repair endonuclease MutL [Candidatus Colimorpha pelethequi]